MVLVLKHSSNTLYMLTWWFWYWICRALERCERPEQENELSPNHCGSSCLCNVMSSWPVYICIRPFCLRVHLSRMRRNESLSARPVVVPVVQEIDWLGYTYSLSFLVFVQLFGSTYEPHCYTEDSTGLMPPTWVTGLVKQITS
jgi:hypothetical protein